MLRSSLLRHKNVFNVMHLSIGEKVLKLWKVTSENLKNREFPRNEQHQNFRSYS